MKKVLLLSILTLILYGCSIKDSPKVNQIIQKTENIQDTIAPRPTKILETGLPDKHLIETSFIPQAPEKKWDQPWQDACEEAALLTVDYFYKKTNPSVPELLNRYQEIFNFENIQKMSHDVNIDQMSYIGQNFLKYQTKIIEDPSVEELKKYLSKDIPIIVPANGKTLFKENKRFKNGGPWYHNLVILGYDDNRQQFIVHDVGTQFGAYFKYSYTLLISSLHDFPESQNKQDIDAGKKRVLILIKLKHALKKYCLNIISSLIIIM